jgi:hypothetical protein
MEEITIQLPKIMVNVLKGFARKKEIDYQTLIVKWLDEKIVEIAKTNGDLRETIFDEF